MPVQHSVFNDFPDVRLIGNFAVLPLRTKYRGPAYQTSEYDIVDEVVDLFRVNSFFRNFEIKGAADRTLVYGILFVNECLNNLRQSPNHHQAQKTLNVLASDDFAIPGEPAFPLNGIYLAPAAGIEADTLRQYLSQFRQELAERLLSYVYALDTSAPSKNWMAFSRKRFMGLSLAAR
ncbi:Arc18 protein [Starmerella bacillaris]|uniref:Actin-related protein 2/3 complex subunit 3 n=1 Tax=Starmerella bacillaris TaxID=1247836 RepID=A0AAV5RMM9_STABA|nr:Arc18 protein [Starmerella bacillaris]